MPRYRIDLYCEGFYDAEVAAPDIETAKQMAIDEAQNSASDEWVVASWEEEDDEEDE